VKLGAAKATAASTARTRASLSAELPVCGGQAVAWVALLNTNALHLLQQIEGVYLQQAFGQWHQGGGLASATRVQHDPEANRQRFTQRGMARAANKYK
jgi:hypothetical protein